MASFFETGNQDNGQLEEDALVLFHETVMFSGEYSSYLLGPLLYIVCKLPTSVYSVYVALVLEDLFHKLPLLFPHSQKVRVSNFARPCLLSFLVRCCILIQLPRVACQLLASSSMPLRFIFHGR